MWESRDNAAPEVREVKIVDGQVIPVMGDEPPTHIQKVCPKADSARIFNEVFCTRLANAVGITAVELELRRERAHDVAMIKLGDRSIDPAGNIRPMKRTDLEDRFADKSAYGAIAPAENPTFAEYVALLRRKSSIPALDILKLLDTVMFNALIGNHGQGARAFFMLELPKGTIRLAPLEGPISTMVEDPGHVDMAIPIGSAHEFGQVSLENLEKMAEQAGLGKAQAKARVREMAERTFSALDFVDVGHPIQNDLVSLIAKRCLEILGMTR